MLPTEWKTISLQKIQHREDAPLLMGCPSCRHFAKHCSGLNLELGLIDCQDFCNCADPSKCDVVCEAAPERFVKRLREVDGFGMRGITFAHSHIWPVVDAHIPVIDKPLEGFSAASLRVGAMPFRAAISRTRAGLAAYSDSELQQRFNGRPEQGWILTGVDHDARIEAIWALGRAGRKSLFAGLKNAGIVAATSPNFSAMADVPRTDNFHARKRILIIWEEMNEAGIPTALHVNGRTQGDFDYFADALNQSGSRAISFEFATGAAAVEAGDRFVGRLLRLVDRVGGPLTLVARGGAPHYQRLLPAFSAVVQVDTAAHMKAKYRQVLQRRGPRGYRWVSQRTEVPIGSLLTQAIEHSRWVDLFLRQTLLRTKCASKSSVPTAPQASANDESGQLRLLLDM